MEKLVLIDFCRTVVNFQTLDPFLEFTIKNERYFLYCLLCNRVAKLICRILERILGILNIHVFLYKRLLLRQLTNMTYSQLELEGKAFYDEKIRGNLITLVIDRLLELKEKGYRLIVVSGGSDFYIRYFAEEFCIDNLITAQLEFINGKCTGKMLSECMGTEKVKILKAFLSDNNIVGEFKVGFTDSYSDMPILNLCNQKIIVSKEKHQSWVTEDMEEIVWT